MKNIAQVIDGIVVTIIEMDEMMKEGFVGTLIDVSTTSGTPELGGTYNDTTRVFVKKPVDAHKSEALNQINILAYALHMGSTHSLQHTIYVQKAASAQMYIDAGYPDDHSSYDFVAAEVVATGNSAKMVADAITDNHSAACKRSATIEGMRVSARSKISQSKNNKQIKQIVKDTTELFKTI